MSGTRRSSRIVVMLLFVGALFVLVTPTIVVADEPPTDADRPLQNRDVAAMVTEGIGTSVVLAAVEHAPFEELDASPGALSALRDNGIPESVVSAVRARVAKREGAASQESTEVAGRSREPTTAEDIKLFFSEKPTRTYSELGRVSAGKFSTFGRSRKREAIDGELKKKAAELGGDAVIDITEDFASVSGVVIVLERE